VARTFILGAGFSRYAGLPLGRELWQMVLAEARGTMFFENVLKPDIDWFLAFKERTTGVSQSMDSLDLEELMSLLDIEHFLRFKGIHSWSAQGDRGQLIIRNLIAKVLLSCQQRMTAFEWEPYLAFAARLRPLDLVITFNYDTLVEDSLEHLRVPYRLVPFRFDYVEDDTGYTESDDTEVTVLKVHGSIDWFDSSHWERKRRYFAEHGGPLHDNDPIFGRPEVFEPRPIAREPYVDSPLRQVMRVKDLGRYLSRNDFVFAAPLILAPSAHKLLYSEPLKEFWWGMQGVGSLNELVAIVGFSLPPHDEYAVQALFNLIANFQEEDTGGLIKKLPVRIVDKRESEEDRQSLRDRYRFVDWGLAELDYDGFRPEAVRFLFSPGS
jgi:hypothetical protein